MSSVTVNISNHDELTKDGVTLLYFWAAWCGPCKQFGPVYEKISEDFPDVIFGKVDVDNEQDLAVSYGVKSIPSIVAYRNGEIVYAQPGAMASTDLSRLAKRLLAGKRV